MRARSAFLVAGGLLAVAASSCVCGVTPDAPPELRPAAVGTIVGTVYIENPTRASVDGATIQVYGSSARTLSQVDKQFVLKSVPLGEHTVLIDHPASGRSIRVSASLDAPYQTLTLAPEQTTLLRAATVTGTVALSGPGDVVNAVAYLVGGSGQRAAVNADGTFALPGLPSGPAEIAVSMVGYDTAVTALTLGEGDNAAPATITLLESSVGDLTISGRVQLAGLTDHIGTTVLLNGGEQVASTTSTGAFTFSGLAPGLFSLRAERDGFQSVVLPEVALTADGEAHGLVDMFMAPGNDAQAAQQDDVSINILSPVSGQHVPGGVSLVMAADVSPATASSTSTVVWTASLFGGSGEPIALGQGPNIVARLPGAAGSVYEIHVDLMQGGAVITSDEVLVTVDSTIVPQPSVSDPRIASLLAQAPNVEVVDDDGTPVPRITIARSQPIDLVVNDPTVVGVTWVSDTGFTFDGAAHLGVLPTAAVGAPHRFTVTTTTADAQQAQSTVLVVVLPLTFTVSVLSPAEGAALYDTGVVSYAAQFTHGFQAAFPTSDVVWRDAITGDVLGLGTVGHFDALPTGAHRLTVELRDVAGNRAHADVDFTVSALSLAPSFAAPANFSTFGDSAPIAFSVNANPSVDLFTPDQLRVSLFSSRDGLLVPEGAADPFFAPGSTVQVRLTTLGTHTITAIVEGDDGTTHRQDNASIQVTLADDSVRALLVQPAQPAFVYDGAGVLNFRVLKVPFDATYEVVWYADGQPVTFDDGDGDATTLNLGTYVSTNAPFNAAPWLANAEHVVTALVRNPGVTGVTVAADGACSGAALAAGTAVCVQQEVHILDQVDGPGVVGTAGADTLIDTDTTWHGTVVMLGHVHVINGATLFVEPGTHVIVDPRGHCDTAYDGAGLALSKGHLLIGQPGGQQVTFEAIASAGTCHWRGIYTENFYSAATGYDFTTASDPQELDIANTLIRDTYAGIDEYSGALETPTRTVSLTNVEVADSTYGYSNLRCPNAFDNVRFTRIQSTALNIADSAPCDDARRTYDGHIVVDGASTGITVNSARRFVFADLDISRTTSLGLNASGNGMDVTVSDSRFAENTGGYGAVYVSASNERAVIANNTFVDNTFGVQMYLYDAGSAAEIVGNTFTNQTTNALRIAASVDNDRVHVHMNAFKGTGTYIDATQYYYETASRDLSAQGNFIGGAGDGGSPGKVLFETLPGTAVNLPRIVDSFDQDYDGYVVARVDNPLPQSFVDSAHVPAAIILEPRTLVPYRSDQCLPMRAWAPSSAGPGALEACTWTIDGSAATVDVDGCRADGSALSEGVHTIELSCAGVPEHASRFFVDDSRWSGTLSHDTTWTGDVIVDGDVVVPAGVTLTVAAGSTVSLKGGDRERFSVPSIARRGGSPRKIDLVVQGALVVAGTAGAPARFVPSSGVPASDQWGSIFVDEDATVDVDHATFAGASRLFQGALDVNNPFAAPRIALRDVAVTNTDVVFWNVCPVELTRANADGTQALIEDGYCFTDLPIVDSVFTNVQPYYYGNWITANLYTDASLLSPVTVSLINSEVHGLPGQEVGTLIGTTGSAKLDKVELLGSTVTDFAYVAYSPRPIVATDSTFERFTGFVNGTANLLTVDHCTFRDGGTVLGTRPVFASFQRTRFEAMTFGFNFDLTSGTAQFLDVVDSQFEGVGTPFRFTSNSYYDNPYYPLGVTLSGLNFIDTGVFVLDLEPYVGGPYVLRTAFDIGGSYWGVTTPAAVEALIDDPRADASAVDATKGATSYAGFVAVPLALDLP